jgi:hypothetical protein
MEEAVRSPNALPDRAPSLLAAASSQSRLKPNRPCPAPRGGSYAIAAISALNAMPDIDPKRIFLQG